MGIWVLQQTMQWVIWSQVYTWCTCYIMISSQHTATVTQIINVVLFLENLSLSSIKIMLHSFSFHFYPFVIQILHKLPPHWEQLLAMWLFISDGLSCDCCDSVLHYSLHGVAKSGLQRQLLYQLNIWTEECLAQNKRYASLLSCKTWKVGFKAVRYVNPSCSVTFALMWLLDRGFLLSLCESQVCEPIKHTQLVSFYFISSFNLIFCCVCI